MAPIVAAPAEPLFRHSSAFRRRRFLNWFPLGLSYAFLYMGRYNLTVAKTSLGDLMTKEQFGIIFGVGTFVYAFAFLVNGPLIDRLGGRRGMIGSTAGAMAMNFAMAAYLFHILRSGDSSAAPLTLVFSLLYALNMYFQSFGAVSIVKVNAHWFHVNERGGFSGIFGTMISSGIFFAFTGNAWLLDGVNAINPGHPNQWVIFAIPAMLLGSMCAIEFFLLRDRPGQAGFEDFDTGDASSGDTSETPERTGQLLKRILTNPIILTIALIEFCTGVLRNGVMHWFPFYAKEIWALPGDHLLRYGSREHWEVAVVCFAVSAISGFLATRTRGSRRAYLIIAASLAFLAPFFMFGWGGLLMIAGVIGGNVAGWVSDLVFQSRRGPVAAALYAVMIVCTIVMAFVLAPASNVVASAKPASGLQKGDRIVTIAGHEHVKSWSDVRHAVACWEPLCKNSSWDAKSCMCSARIEEHAPGAGVDGKRGIPATLVRGGKTIDVTLHDAEAVQRAGDHRLLPARPVLPMSPFFLGAIVFLISVCVIGCHGVLSGTATMDFGGRKGAATAVGAIDGFVYLGTAVQAVSLGFLTTKSWTYWPLFLIPFSVVGFVLSLRIWNAKPKGADRPPAREASDDILGPSPADLPDPRPGS